MQNVSYSSGKESEDVTVNHVCKKEDIETAKLLKENTKPCPSCNMGVYKIEGCSQMFCTSCKTAFGWTTGRSSQETSIILIILNGEENKKKVGISLANQKISHEKEWRSFREICSIDTTFVV